MFPPTEVSWFLNQSPLTVGTMNQMYSASQIVRDTLSTTYDSVLTVRGGQGGRYRCDVSNNRGPASGELFVNGTYFSTSCTRDLLMRVNTTIIYFPL